MGDRILQRLTFYQYATGIYINLYFYLVKRTPASLWFICFSSISGRRFSRRTGRLYLNRYKRHLAAICKGPDLTAVAQKSLQRLGASSAKCTKVTIQLKCCKGFRITIIRTRMDASLGCADNICFKNISLSCRFFVKRKKKGGGGLCKMNVQY